MVCRVLVNDLPPRVERTHFAYHPSPTGRACEASRYEVCRSRRIESDDFARAVDRRSLDRLAVRSVSRLHKSRALFGRPRRRQPLRPFRPCAAFDLDAFRRMKPPRLVVTTGLTEIVIPRRHSAECRSRRAANSGRKRYFQSASFCQSYPPAQPPAGASGRGAGKPMPRSMNGVAPVTTDAMSCNHGDDGSATFTRWRVTERMSNTESKPFAPSALKQASSAAISFDCPILRESSNVMWECESMRMRNCESEKMRKWWNGLL